MENSKSTNQKQVDLEEKTLWIGNLDPRVTEYQLLKLMQKHGTIEKFDLLFHRIGPLAGQPRGYAFVTFTNRQEAIIAKNALNSKLVGCKNIIVTWAHTFNSEEYEKPKPEIPALAMAKDEKKSDRVSQIQAIEAKLKLMENKREDELKINDTVATKTPVINQFQYNKDKVKITQKPRSSSRRTDNRHYKPYSKSKKR